MKFIKKKKYVAIIGLIASLVLFIPLLFNDHSSCRRETNVLPLEKKIFYCFGDDISLCDKNDIHLFFARRNGLQKTYKTDKEFLQAADSLRNCGSLVYISDKKNYILKRLTHSHPYLTREARELLHEIGLRFDKKQIEKGLKPHKIIVTSLLRTEQSQKSLRRVNVNATQETTSHLYGTTFDISHQKFVKKDFFGNESFVYRVEYKKILEEVLQELRLEQRCVVVRERKQACFHITVANLP
jgi:hypothetical protein